MNAIQVIGGVATLIVVVALVSVVVKPGSTAGNFITSTGNAFAASISAAKG